MLQPAGPIAAPAGFIAAPLPWTWMAAWLATAKQPAIPFAPNVIKPDRPFY